MELLAVSALPPAHDNVEKLQEGFCGSDNLPFPIAEDNLPGRKRLAEALSGPREEEKEPFILRILLNDMRSLNLRKKSESVPFSALCGERKRCDLMERARGKRERAVCKRGSAERGEIGAGISRLESVVPELLCPENQRAECRGPQ